jgi:predicted enzyme related to lactoylglutathione lyase
MSTGTQTRVGQIIWHDLMTTDVDRATAFYTALLGWELEPWEMEGQTYQMIKANDQQHGGFVSLDPSHGHPSHWTGYVAVEDIDATVAAARGAGATIAVEPTPIPEVGRFAVLADPQGAVISLLQPAYDSPAPTGAFAWDELLAVDPDGAKAFYERALGWTSAGMDMGEHGSYTLFKRAGGEDAAGMLQKPAETGGPAAWLPYLQSGDVDADFARAKELGATAFVEPAEIPGIGRFAVLADPTGATFGLWGQAES